MKGFATRNLLGNAAALLRHAIVLTPVPRWNIPITIHSRGLARMRNHSPGISPNPKGKEDEPESELEGEEAESVEIGNDRGSDSENLSYSSEEADEEEELEGFTLDFSKIPSIGPTRMRRRCPPVRPTKGFESEDDG